MKYQWNLENLVEVSKNMKKEIGNIREQLSFLEREEAKILSYWQGDAALQFRANILEDIDKLKNLQSMAEHEEEKLGKTIACYEDGESRIHEKMNALYNSIC